METGFYIVFLDNGIPTFATPQVFRTPEEALNVINSVPTSRDLSIMKLGRGCSIHSFDDFYKVYDLDNEVYFDRKFFILDEARRFADVIEQTRGLQ